MTPAIRLLEASGVAFSIHEYERGEELKDFGREAAESLASAASWRVRITSTGGPAFAASPWDAQAFSRARRVTSRSPVCGAGSVDSPGSSAAATGATVNNNASVRPVGTSR